MAVRDIQREMEALTVFCRSESGEVRAVALHQAFRDKVNVVVAKAAKIAAELNCAELIPDLCAAFERLLNKGAKTDPQCWAKEAIAKALRDLGHIDSAVF